jgi:2-octaprenyl-6-methoxyphenol hydroxylase
MRNPQPICILGGGLVGGVMALDLAQRGFQVIVVDAMPSSSALNPDSDGRTTAVNLASKHYFEQLGLWTDLSPHGELIKTITVYAGNTPWSTHFNHQDVGPDPMGYILDNPILKKTLLTKALEHPLITWLAPASLISKKITSSGALLYIQLAETSEIREINTPLLICAEGRNSKTREDMSLKTYQFPYQQRALVFSVTHERPHNNRAWEVFYPDGPLAFLPAKDHEGKPRSGVVWALPLDQGSFWKDQEHRAIEIKLETLFPHLGALTLCTKVWDYPLSAQLAKDIIADRFVIIGDAAHTFHPVAGQGVNVGWRDAKQLGEILGEARSLGSDLGSGTTLSRYQRHRCLDTLSVFAMTDGLVRLFSNDSSMLGLLRGGGLGVVNRIPPLKKYFMKRAMGYV